MKYILSILFAVTITTACVPLQQFSEIKEKNQQLQDNADMLSTENDALNVKNKEVSSELKRYKRKAELLAQDTARISRQLQRMQHRYDDLNTDYANAIKGIKSKPGNDVDNKKLLQFLQQLQEDLQMREDALITAENELNDKQRSLDNATNELSLAKESMLIQNNRLSELEQILIEKEADMQKLRKSINKALVGFSDDELHVHMKNGKVYVSLEEKLLFQSGSYHVNEQGVNALKKIAGVLEQNKDVEIVIEGHTDNIPYKGSSALKDNWDLSVKRATSVVRIMLNNSNISPKQITAAGRGEHIPVMKGDHSIALQKNRRTEIILTPKLDEVISILEDN